MEFASGSTSLQEIFRISEDCVYQCPQSHRIIVKFNEDTLVFKIPCFFAFKRQVEKIDLQKMLLDPSKGSDIEILKVCGADRILVLSTYEVLALKSLLEGTKVMFELNRILSDRLCSTCR